MFLKGLEKQRKINENTWPFKGINKEIKGDFPKSYIKLRVLKLRFLAFSRGSGGFRELREAGRKYFHLSWYLLVSVVTSYGQNLERARKTKENQRKQMDTYARPLIVVKIFRFCIKKNRIQKLRSNA